MAYPFSPYILHVILICFVLSFPLKDAEPASEQPPRVDSRASDKSQPIDTYEMIVQSVLGTEEARAPEIKKKRRRKRSRPGTVKPIT